MPVTAWPSPVDIEATTNAMPRSIRASTKPLAGTTRTTRVAAAAARNASPGLSLVSRVRGSDVTPRAASTRSRHVTKQSSSTQRASTSGVSKNLGDAMDSVASGSNEGSNAATGTGHANARAVAPSNTLGTVPEEAGEDVVAAAASQNASDEVRSEYRSSHHRITMRMCEYPSMRTHLSFLSCVMLA